MKNGKIERTQEHAIAQVSPDTIGLMRRAYAKSTLECRRKILKKLDNWLQGREITDPILAEYMTHLFTQGNAPATIRNVLSTAKWVLKLKNKGKGVDLPICTANLAGICREGRDRGSGQRNGLTWENVEKICAVQEADGTLMGLRNSAIIRIASDAMLRVSELLELRVSDLQGKYGFISGSQKRIRRARANTYISARTPGASSRSGWIEQESPTPTAISFAV